MSIAGLSLVLNIGVYEYLPFLTEDSGIRVVIHDQKAMPFPSRDGVSVSPGQLSNVAVDKVCVNHRHDIFMCICKVP